MDLSDYLYDNLLFLVNGAPLVALVLPEQGYHY